MASLQNIGPVYQHGEIGQPGDSANLHNRHQKLIFKRKYLGKSQWKKRKCVLSKQGWSFQIPLPFLDWFLNKITHFPVFFHWKLPFASVYSQCMLPRLQLEALGQLTPPQYFFTFCLIRVRIYCRYLCCCCCHCVVIITTIVHIVWIGGIFVIVSFNLPSIIHLTSWLGWFVEVYSISFPHRVHNCRFGANCAIQKLIGGKLFSNKIFPRLISRCFFCKSFF